MNSIFYIEKITEEYSLEIAPIAFEPHRHDFEELVIYSQGKIKHFIDFSHYTLQAPLACFVSQGKLHKVQMLEDEQGRYPAGWLIRFRSEFIPESKFQLYSNYHNFANIPFVSLEHFDQAIRLCEIIDQEHQASQPEYNIIRSLLNTLFIIIETERRKQEPNAPALSNQNDTFKSFLKILEDNFRRDTGVDFYAEKLNMSVRNLNLICQNILQKSVSEIIETRKLIEAKDMLLNTDKTISEIGFDLGYNEKAYFSQVFKKKSGMTPSEFRHEMAKLTS